MRILSIITTVFLSINMLACGSPEGNPDQELIAKNVQVKEFHDLHAEKGGQIVDVRTAEELEGGYIPSANHIDFYSSDFDTKIAELDKDKPVFVYCAVGGRSGKAMSKMNSMGFKEVYNLSGGFPKWKEAGYEVEKK